MLAALIRRLAWLLIELELWFEEERCIPYKNRVRVPVAGRLTVAD